MSLNLRIAWYTQQLASREFRAEFRPKVVHSKQLDISLALPLCYTYPLCRSSLSPLLDSTVQWHSVIMAKFKSLKCWEVSTSSHTACVDIQKYVYDRERTTEEQPTGFSILLQRIGRWQRTKAGQYLEILSVEFIQAVDTWKSSISRHGK